MRNTNGKIADSEKEKLNPDGRWAQARPSQQFNVVRRVYQQDALNKDADYHTPRTHLGSQCRKALRNCGFGECVRNLVPAARWAPRYTRHHLVGDLIAGATTAVMHIPQGMAYALLAEVPPIVGLYMAFFPALVYAALGTSPHISVGTFAVACLMAGKVVSQHATHEFHGNATLANATLAQDTMSSAVQYTPLQVLSVVTLAVGIFQVLMWVMRLGAVSTLLSEPLVSGFTTAASFHVLASQLKDLFGVKIPKLPGNHKVLFTVIEVCKALPGVNYAALVISFITCLIIALNNEVLKPWVSKRSRVPVPIELFAVVAGALISRFADLHSTYGISLVGDIPTGLPTPVPPPIELLPRIAVDAVTITIVTYTISMSMALIFASKEKYEVDANQELLALGAGNVFGAFFSCAPLCASLSRSYIQYQAGSRTTVTTMVSALLVLCVLLWVGPFFQVLPRCVLASIIVVSLKGMFMQVTELAKFWKLSRLDAVVWLVTFVITAFVNIDIGLGAGLVASVGALFCRSQMPYTCLLGRVADTDLYLDIKRYRAAEEIPGIKIFHYCGGLNFATKNLFRSTLLRKVGVLRPADQPADSGPSADAGAPPGGLYGKEVDTVEATGSYEWDDDIRCKVRCVVVDATALSYVDAPGVRALAAARAALAAAGLTVLCAGANGPVLEMIERYNALQPAGERLALDTFPTVHDAVVYYKVLEGKRAEHALSLPDE